MMQTSNVKAFLRLIAWSEGTLSHPMTKCEGYDVIVTGVDGPEVFNDFSDHPFVNRLPKKINESLYSTASGRYQLLYRYFKVYKEQLKLNDFSPESQDIIAIQQIKEKKALLDIENNDIESAINKCSNIWASFPGGGYNQPQRNINLLLDNYNKFSAI